MSVSESVSYEIIHLHIHTLSHRQEMSILEHLNWRLTAVVPLHFVEYYMHQHVLYASDLRGDAPVKPGMCVFVCVRERERVCVCVCV
jgi:hypothetical protein